MGAKISWAWVAVVLVSGCSELLGFDGYKATSMSGEGAGGTGGASFTSSGGTTNTTGNAGTDGGGGTGGAGGSLCEPGSKESCYTGAPNTVNVGACKAGTHGCVPDGSGYGPCKGEVTPSAELCTNVADENCDGEPNCTGAHLWSKAFGDSKEQHASEVAVDSAGNTLVIGIFRGSIDFGGGPLTSVGGGADVFVAKFDPAGAPIWSKRFGDGSDQWGWGIAADSAGNVVLTGSFSGSIDFGGGALVSMGNEDVFVAKLDAEGGHLWSKRFGDVSTQTPRAVTTDGAGDVLVTGIFGGSVSFGGNMLVSKGPSDMFLVKLAATGQHLWSKGGFGSNIDPFDVAADKDGNVIVTGSLASAVNFGGGQLSTAGSGDVFVVKYNAAGDHVWSNRFGDAAGQTSRSVAVDEANNLILTGGFAGSLSFGGVPLTSAGSDDVFVAKLDPIGGLLWNKRYGDASTQSGDAIAVDGAGNVVIAGSFEGEIDFGGGALTSSGTGAADFFMTKLAPDGGIVWSKQFGGPANEQGARATVDSSGNLLAAGYFQNFGINFGGGDLPNAGGSDVWVAKLAP